MDKHIYFLFKLTRNIRTKSHVMFMQTESFSLYSWVEKKKKKKQTIGLYQHSIYASLARTPLARSTLGSGLSKLDKGSTCKYKVQSTAKTYHNYDLTQTIVLKEMKPLPQLQSHKAWNSYVKNKRNLPILDMFLLASLYDLKTNLISKLQPYLLKNKVVNLLNKNP